jgi:hypothetical protein
MKKNILVHSITKLMVGSNLKKYIFFIALSLISLGTLANPTLASKQQIGMFKNSITCVVLEDGINYYNVNIKDAVERYWKSTEYEFISQEEFEKRRFDSKYSFLVLMDGVYDKDPGGVSYNYINLVLGNASNNLTKMPELCSIPISYTDDNDADYEYALPSIVKFIQIHAKNLETDRLYISLKGLRFYNSASGFKDKVLLLNKNAMALYYIKLLSPSEIQEEIASTPVNALIHFHVGPSQNSGAGKCFEMIFDVEGNMYYYNYRKITNDNGDGFNLQDFYNIR